MFHNRHPSFPLVKPVSTFRLSLSFTLAIATAWVIPAAAQQATSPDRVVRRSERVARANWQPTRSHVEQSTATRSEKQAKEAGSARRIRRVDHIKVEGVPIPPPDTSVMDPYGPAPIEAPVPMQSHLPMEGYVPMETGAPLDGQVSLAPLHGGSLACDALPSGQCGCGDALCLGGCDDGCDSGYFGAGNCNACGRGDCTTCGELCSDNAWRPCVTLCIPQDGWVSLEYLSWWQDGMDLPPLVTTSSDPNVARSDAGVLGRPTTQTIFGDGTVLDESFDGGRLRFGIWLNRRHTWGAGAELFKIGSESESFSATSTGTPILARPFFNTQTGVEDAELVAFPNVVTGTVGVTASSELSGAGFHFRYLTRCDEGCARWLFCGYPEKFCSRHETMFGWRFLQLDESVQITENLVSTDTANPGSFDILDQFDTRNQFNGFDLGWMYKRTRGYWTFDSLIRMAIGNTRQTVTIDGRTTINDPNNTPTVQTLPGGLLAQTSNIGVFRQNEFTVVPEFNANVGYQLTDHLRMMLGYSFIYWSNVVRPGQHISRDLNPALLPPPQSPFNGAQRPEFAFDTTDYWVQGLSFGGEYRW